MNINESKKTQLSVLKIGIYSVGWVVVYMFGIFCWQYDAASVAPDTGTTTTWIIVTLLIPFIFYFIALAIKNKPYKKETLVHMLLGMVGGGILFILFGLLAGLA